MGKGILQAVKLPKLKYLSIFLEKLNLADDLLLLLLCHRIRIQFISKCTEKRHICPKSRGVVRLS